MALKATRRIDRHTPRKQPKAEPTRPDRHKKRARETTDQEPNTQEKEDEEKERHNDKDTDDRKNRTSTTRRPEQGGTQKFAKHSKCRG